LFQHTSSLVTPIGCNSIWDYVLRKQVHRDRQQMSQIRETENKGDSELRNEEQLILGSLKEIISPVVSDPEFQSTILSPEYEKDQSFMSELKSSSKQTYSKLLPKMGIFGQRRKHFKSDSFNQPAVELELSRIQKVGAEKVENQFNIQHAKLNPQFLKTPDKPSCCCLIDSDNIKFAARLKKSPSISGATSCQCNCGDHNQRSQVRNIIRGMETNKLKISVRL
jgi:hypothetical protein